MKIWKPGEKQRSNTPLVLIYGETNVGKSTSSLASLPEPILDIVTEPRDPEIALRAIGRKVDVTFVMIEDVEEVSDFLGEKSLELRQGKLPYKSILLDSGSYLLNVAMMMKAEAQTAEAGVFKSRQKVGGVVVEKFERPFIDETKLDYSAWGAIGRHMMRITALLGEFARNGVVAVMTALLDKEPKWDKTGRLKAAPAFAGRYYAVNCPSYFDLIGLVTTRTDEKGEVVYPPLVSFGSPNDDFVAKWTGPRVNPVGVLDFKKILAVFRKGEGKEG